MRRNVVRLAALGLLGLLLGLAFSPPALQGEVGGRDAARVCRGKLERLASTLRQGESAQDSFREDEINAHLVALLNQNRRVQTAKGLTVGVQDLRLHMGEAPTFYVDTRLLSLPLVFSIGFESCGEGRPRTRSVSVGRLPMVGPFRSLVQGRMKPLFSRLRNEKIVWDHFAACEVEDKIITVSVAGETGESTAAGRT